MTRLRLFAAVATVSCLVGWTDANATTQRWHRSPWACNHGARRYTPAETRCVVRRAFLPEGQRIARQALRVLWCESRDGTEAYPALGPMQWLASTWRQPGNPYRRHSPRHPVWNALASRWLFDASGRTWQQWSCKP